MNSARQTNHLAGSSAQGDDHPGLRLQSREKDECAKRNAEVGHCEHSAGPDRLVEGGSEKTHDDRVDARERRLEARPLAECIPEREYAARAIAAPRAPPGPAVIAAPR